MGVRYSSLTAVALGALALGTGCMSADGKKSAVQKPDVMKAGVLPPPQETTRSIDAPTGAATGPVVQASATTAADAQATSFTTPTAAPGGGGSAAIAKLSAKLERKVVATEFAVGWQNRIAYLPDPAKSGRMSPGIAGQMFLFGGPKLEFAQADGVLTVDLVDDSPRQPGQPAATPERWQFPREILRNLQTRDETFGKSYVLFLPWPSYKPSVTRVKISARYDPENGSPLFAAPTTITFDSTPFGAPVWKDVSKERAGEGPAPSVMPPVSGNRSFGSPVVQTGPAIPLGGATAPMIPIHTPSAQAPMMPMPGAAAPISIPNGGASMMPIPNGPMPIPGRGDGFTPAPAGAMPIMPAAPGGPALGSPALGGPAPNAAGPMPGDVPPIAIMLPGPSRQ